MLVRILHTPIRFSANRQVAGASVELLGTGTGEVEINAPLKVEGASAMSN